MSDIKPALTPAWEDKELVWAPEPPDENGEGYIYASIQTGRNLVTSYIGKAFEVDGQPSQVASIFADEFREAAQAWRDGQAIDVVEQVTEEVPVEKIKRITQSRDDFQKVNTEWVNGMNWNAMSTRLGDKFDADTLKNKALELGSYEKMVKWAKQNAPEIVSSGGSRPGFTKTTIEKGKTNWSDG